MADLLTTLLSERECLITDGATGTNLFGMGLSQGYPPEFWNVEQADKIRRHYREFVEAGSDIVLTNTFGGTANRLKLHKAQDRVHEINARAANLLADEIRRSGRVVVNAGSVGPLGELFRPLGELSHEQGVAAFSEQVRGLKDGGVDVVWIETMFSEVELRAAVEAAALHDLPAVVTMSFDTSGRTMMGQTPRDFLELARGLTPALVAYGGNCGTGAPDLLAGLLSIKDQLTPADVFVVKANCGLPELIDGKVCYTGTPELMAEYARMARDSGARIIGGCCGTTAAHVQAMRAALESTPRGPSPTLDEITTRIGPLTGSTRSLVEGGGPTRRPRRQREVAGS
ncbi:MAG: betaine--homocysteine S-methyltransferase [Hyphomicrobiaceae bacterium]|nr:betaine--homocysteine S-methyltransferase [Hyphomicrobiaceae bacterium]